jgi:hypothetical protein
MPLVVISVACILLLIGLAITTSYRDRLLTQLRTSAAFTSKTWFGHQIDVLSFWSLVFILALIGLGIVLNVFFYFLE